jgi:hypothetical protein
MQTQTNNTTAKVMPNNKLYDLVDELAAADPNTLEILQKMVNVLRKNPVMFKIYSKFLIGYLK